jgi:hypothetical protein
MSGSDENLTLNQERAILALLSEPTQQAAAEKAEVGASTLRRWLSEPAFLAAYRQARRALVEGAIAKLQAASVEAVDTLRDLLKCTDKPAVQARAAVAILEQAIKGGELIALTERVEELERMLKEARNELGDVEAAGQEPGDDGRGEEQPGQPAAGPSVAGPGQGNGADASAAGSLASDVPPLAI